jgi:hypothetical protein
MSFVQTSSALETILAEVEESVAHIMRAYSQTKEDVEITQRAIECCRFIREVVAANDAPAAALAGCQIGELLERLHLRAGICRHTASPPNRLVERAHRRDVERRAAYFAALRRGFSPAGASKKAAEKLGVTPKTIMRAVNGH